MASSHITNLHRNASLSRKKSAPSNTFIFFQINSADSMTFGALTSACDLTLLSVDKRASNKAPAIVNLLVSDSQILNLFCLCKHTRGFLIKGCT